ncbi:hypothetical protein BU24DRAFT_365004 [Aaosphaeria arxii CBS 175.79]|uniref:Trichothecene 3-O-acetyltransferas-like protein n=1 Tax=Aaosphaeria arxii CBS 175.79 TaxID=1450172 RepID=A0A6A5Y3V3_9PLEO|nr:uncharacterized protein BU24DRAFT_365004 [Aaosphaeria arxii CBS 175.79]KAF2019490.1 hypothetical protein BU24DRAFT_365004 [Aaosphaeria arxii CBS 175.79]
MAMENTETIERLSPFDLLMPRTYVSAVFAFQTIEPMMSISKRLQHGLDSLSQQLPWLCGLVLPTTATRESRAKITTAGLEIRWNANVSIPTIIEKGTIEASYHKLAADGMPPSAIPADVWPMPSIIDDTLFESGAPVFGASLFQFADSQGVGLCVSLHHNVVDATGFAEVIRLWARHIAGFTMHQSDPALSRVDRLSQALSFYSTRTSVELTDDLIASHPEHSRTAPTLPAEFAPCTTKLFKIPMIRINAIKQQLGNFMPTLPTTNTLICALIWSSITRARMRRSSVAAEQCSQLVMAVNGRRHISTELSSPDNPYFGNVVVFSLAKHPIHDLSKSGDMEQLAGICNTIARSQSPTRLNTRYIAEVYNLVGGLSDYRTLFPGWDLFNSRDLTITSWADLDLYATDFGATLGRPEFIRVPYVEADGVGIILPRKRTAREELEVLIMLRSEDMECLDFFDG